MVVVLHPLLVELLWIWNWAFILEIHRQVGADRWRTVYSSSDLRVDESRNFAFQSALY